MLVHVTIWVDLEAPSIEVPYPSTKHRDHYVANEAVVQLLRKDVQYMQCYRQARAMLFQRVKKIAYVW